ncbi:MAG: hypothetical protein ABIH99_06130 [Candidatus Micrarchaeota archaeon]
MVKNANEVTEETINQGGVLALFYFDVQGNNEEMLKNSLVEFVGRITHEAGVVYAIGRIEEVIKMEDTFVTSAEVKLLAKDFSTLLNVAIRYGPIGAEILKPNSITLSMSDAQGIVLNLAQTSHEFSKFVMEKLLTKDEQEKFRREMVRRAEAGKQLLNKKEGKKEEGAPNAGN